MAVITGTRKDGTEWTPEFVSELDKEKCIACGRCFKSCPQGVFNLEEDEDDEGNEINFMVIENDELCIGCKTCSKVCGQNALSHESLNLN